ncbi:MAG: N-acetylmuramoyl-L-alanine amidase [Oscillospiraceae bacterium]|nr:N-acetylmuramoyl-L-alanine amidase [Oscillospiraceae bacterium]
MNTTSTYRGNSWRKPAAPLRLFLIMAMGLVLIGAAMLSMRDKEPEPALAGAAPDVVIPPETDKDPPLVQASAMPDSRPLVAVDAGHGGADGGAGPVDGVCEKTINLDIALRLRDILESSGIRVLMIRDDDETVNKERRAEMANEAGADIFVSIHQNADDSGAQGVETWVDENDPEGRILAQLIQTAVAEATGARDRGLWTSGKLVVLRETAMPSCLVETGFITGHEELELLKTAEYRETIARGIAEGIHRYLYPDQPPLFFENLPPKAPDLIEPYGWGLRFHENGRSPSGNLSSEELAQYNAAFMGDPAEKKLYLTFDAGYEDGHMASILDTLARHDVPAAFFLVGHYIRTNPELTRRMVEDDHIVANHTMSHPDMTALTEIEDYRAELSGLEDLYKETTGQELSRYLRPPEGKYSEHSLKQADYLGYKTVFWSLAYVDWEKNQPTKQQAFDKLLPRTHPGAVILLHSTSRTNEEILDELLTRWKDEGYTFGTLDGLFE